MNVVEHNKLVRDLIPEIIVKNNGVPSVRIADESEYVQRLKDKLEEEVAEYLESGELEELSDILEVIHALARVNGSDFVEIERLRIEKALKRGAFERRIILESTKG